MTPSQPQDIPCEALCSEESSQKNLKQMFNSVVYPYRLLISNLAFYFLGHLYLASSSFFKHIYFLSAVFVSPWICENSPSV